MVSKLESLLNLLAASTAPVSPTVVGGTITTRVIPPAVSRGKECLTSSMYDNDVYSLFVTGSEKGPHHFFCMIYCKDVSLNSKGKREFKRHFQEGKHFLADQQAGCSNGAKSVELLRPRGHHDARNTHRDRVSSPCHPRR